MGLLIIAMCATLTLTGANLAAPQVLRRMTAIVSSNMTQADMSEIIRLMFILLAIYILRVLFRYVSNFMAHKAAWRLVQDLRQRVYDHIQSFSMGFFHSRQTGDLMSRVVNDTATFELLYAHIIPEMVTNVVTIIGVSVILLTINARLALLTCVPLPFIVASGWVFTRKVQPKFKVMQRSLADLNSQLHDNFNGIMEIQAFNQQKRESVNVRDRLTAFTRNMLSALNLSAVFHPGVEFLTSMGTVIVVGAGGYLALQNQLDVSDIIGFLLYLSLFYAPVAGIAVLLENFSQALAGAERVLEILDTPAGIVDEPDAVPLPPAKGEIRFENVSFAYDETPVLKNISFTAEPGKMIALVGPTGVGKTTTVQLAARFYEPDSGSIYIDGHDLKHVRLESLRSQIAMVLQDTFLFTGTIEENIAYANPGAPYEDILAAARAARIHDDIMRMPEAYKTQVGERGVKFSGGQKQRIAIARAILRKSPILILDEATASVDAETELLIQRAINDLAGSRTIIAIAHRLSTVRKADRIIVLEDGIISEQGKHEELINRDGAYRKLNMIQNAG
jgi:ABC-type multidrug transport system fused ATPase/permease subunit